MPAKTFVAFTRLDASDVNAFLANKAISNEIINGAFDFWQRGTSFTQASSYTADRWQQSTDKTATISRQTFTPGAAPVAGYEGAFFLRHAASAGGSFQVVQQRVEDVRTFAGQTVTLSYWAKADAAVNNVVIMEQDFGTGGSSAVATSSVTHALTTSWARYTATISVPSITGKTIGTNSSLIVRVIRTIDALAHTVDIWGVQLEPGTVANDFRRNANSIQGELAACQRYYYQWVNSAVDAQFGPTSRASTIFSSMTFFLPVSMRTTPTVVSTASGGVFFRTVEYNTSFNITTGSINAVSVGTSFNSQSIDLNFTRSAGLDGSYVYQTLDTAGVGSSVAFSAEL